MVYQTTVGWSLLTSGIVTLILYILPGDSLWWGIGLLIAGLVVLHIRQDDGAASIPIRCWSCRHRRRVIRR